MNLHVSERAAFGFHYLWSDFLKKAKTPKSKKPFANENYDNYIMNDKQIFL